MYITIVKDLSYIVKYDLKFIQYIFVQCTCCILNFHSEKDRKLKEKLDEIASYINKEDPMILKLRVEMLILENCEDFASNLCNCIIKYEQFKDDLDLREMQFVLLHKLNQMENLQEEVQLIFVI